VPSANVCFYIFAAKEKLEIVSGAAPPPFWIFAGEFFRENAFGLIQEYCTTIKLSDFCPTDSAARSTERYGNTGSPRTARLAKRRFEIPCDFKYLLFPIKN
jgi:hypothetical protein